MKNIFEILGVVCAVILPLFNIPLIVRIVKRKSSEDFSLYWALGVWVCFLLMAPSGFASEDVVFRTFNVTNLVLFSMVVAAVLKYRKRRL